ncbi:MAG: peptidylprolyl isomerase [Candidatus Competibacteraceae bacterium]|nr:peptidylprolyl isomerase [Candidatus Competibacteraceae bacterium]
MAVIGSIRKRGTLLLIVIGVSMLAFILGSNIFTNLFNEGPDNVVAVIGGKNVNIAEYQYRVADKETLVQTLNPQAEINEMQRQQIADEVWNDILNERVFYKEFEKLGIAISAAEMNDMLVGRTLHPLIISQFTNQQTGVFNAQDVANYAAQFEDESAIPDENLEQWRSARMYWAYLQQSVRLDRLQGKYSSLISKSMYVTSKEAESNFNAAGDRANIRFIMKPYSLIPDSTITLSDDELRSYFNEFKYRYRQKKSRAIKYVVFAGIPTTKDTLALEAEMKKLLAEFKETDDDTLFVRQNSDQNQDPAYFKKGALSPYYDSLLFQTPIGTVAGPYIDNGSFVIARKIGEKESSDSAKARHILLQPTKQEEVELFRSLRDSLFTVLQNGGDFASIAAQYSADESNKKDTGNLGWFTEGMMVRSFNDTVFSSKAGTFKKVDTEFGFHIVYIQAMTKPNKKALVAMVYKQIVPSNETMQEAYNQASDMAFTDKTQKSFDPDMYFEKYCRDKKLVPRDESFITESSRGIMGLDDSRDIIKWALMSKRGEISEVFQSGNNYVVALLTTVRSDGIPKLEDVRKDVEVGAKRHKKALQYIQEFSQAMSGKNNLDEVASAMQLNVNPATDVTFQSFFIPGAGVETELVGAVFGLKQGQLSKPLEGNNGVFVFVTDLLNPAQGTGDYSFNKIQLLSQISSRASTDAMDAVKSSYKIQDKRYLFDVR